MRYDSNNKTHRLVLTGLMAAFIFALTIVLPIPIPNMAGAYVNLGDVGVYMAAAMLGSPWGVLAAAAGSALADLAYGAVIYIAPTFIIKGSMAFLAMLFLSRWQEKRLLPLLCAGTIMPLGYLLFETILYGFAAAVVGLPMNLLQYALGVLLGSQAVRLVQSYMASTGRKTGEG